MKKSKGEIISTLLETVGGLLTIAAGVVALFVKDESEEPVYKLEDRHEDK